ncbi:Charged multivesicular body protein 6-A [Cladobotryum mycophilum]|uniref:Charged multivesicular body protein 6-A n=1 Tax=Cladobotryum mycophilum TaxID=491253 RepID=A0ABR0SYZ8_9HYPO
MTTRLDVTGTESQQNIERDRGWIRGRNNFTMGAKQSKVTAQDKAILDMKIQRDRLHQYQRRITVLTDKETEIARQMLAKGDKKRALLALRRKKYQESLLAKTDAQLEQLEKLTASVEFAQIQKDVVFGLQQGTKEVSEMLGSRITAQDEEEVEDELAALEAEMSGEPRKLPTVPNAQLPVSERPSEQEEGQPERQAMLAA